MLRSRTLNGDGHAAQSISVPEGALNGEAVKFVEKILEQSAVLVNNGWLDSGWTDLGHKIQP